MLLLVVVVIVMLIPCILQCIQRVVEKSVKSIWIAQKQKGGFVGFLEDQGHVVSNPDTQNLIALE